MNHWGLALSLAILDQQVAQAKVIICIVDKCYYSHKTLSRWLEPNRFLQFFPAFTRSDFGQEHCEVIEQSTSKVL